VPDVTVEISGDAAIILIDRPQRSNAISLSTMNGLESALDDVDRIRPKCVVVRGGGDRVFVSGGDVKELASLRTVEQAANMAKRMRSLLDRVASLPVPTVAALNGHALGGGAEVAIACDFRVAADHITIGFNQSRLAIMPAWGGADRLVDLVGRTQALRLLLTGMRVGAVDAKRMGLLNAVTPQCDFDASCSEFVDALLHAPHSVVTAIKQAVHAAKPNNHASTEVSAIDAFAALWVADDHWAAVEAMQDHRAQSRVNPTSL